MQTPDTTPHKPAAPIALDYGKAQNDNSAKRTLCRTASFFTGIATLLLIIFFVLALLIAFSSFSDEGAGYAVIAVLLFILAVIGFGTTISLARAGTGRELSAERRR